MVRGKVRASDGTALNNAIVELRESGGATRINQERGDREAAARELESYLKAEPGPRNAPAIKEAIRKLREKK